jgi:formate hydrogenlyase transcriptional activator
MKKLQMLLEQLLEEVEREDEEILEPSASRQLNGNPESARAWATPNSRERLRPIVQDLQSHQVKLQAEDQLRASEIARISRLSRFQEAEIKALIESLPDGVLIGTREGFSICNGSALRILGISGMTAIGEPEQQIRAFNLRWPDGRVLTEPELPFVRALNGETVVEEYLLTRPNTGEKVYLRTTAAPILDAGEIAGAVAIHTDLSELRAQAEQLRQACEKADNLYVQLQRQTAELNVQLDRIVSERTQEVSQSNVSLAKALAEVEELKDRLEAENAYLHLEHNLKYSFDEVIGDSEALREVFSRIETVAPQDSTVLLLGETGTGKGMLARAIHARSPRKDRPMVMVNCASLPGSLIESELFGREKGAFTGANAQQIGRFELADKGTLFLDEIGELPLELQGKLLHAIQEKEFSRLGSPRTIKVNVRIIAATNRDLKEEIAKGRFREDLYYRLNIFPVEVPPLRQHREDIPLLVQHFLRKFCGEMGKDIQRVSEATLKKLVNHSWPGNVRELENVIERAVITTQGDTLQVLDQFSPSGPEPEAEDGGCQTLAELEHAHILKTLKRTRGRIDGRGGAAELLGLHPSTLRGRMRKQGIQPLEWAAC